MVNVFSWQDGRNWYSTAKALKKASDKAREAYLEAYNKISVPVRLSFCGTKEKIKFSDLSDLDQYPIAMLLMGYSMENIFKGIIICSMWLNNPKSVDFQNFDDLNAPSKYNGQGIHLAEHGLRRLTNAKDMNLDFNPEEKKTMDYLNDFVIWAGRYPTPKEQNQNDPNGVKYFLKKSEPIEYPYQKIDSLYQKSMEELVRVCMQQRDKT